MMHEEFFPCEEGHAWHATFFLNGCRRFASGIIWLFHSPFLVQHSFAYKCMTCFEGLLFYDFGAGAQAVLLADAVLIPDLVRINWNEKACCPLNFYECRPLLCRDVFNQMGCILHFLIAWISMTILFTGNGLGNLILSWVRSCLFFHHCSFPLIWHIRKAFCIHFLHCPGQPWLYSLWRRSSPRCTRRFVRHLPRLIYPARLLEFHYMHLWFELYFSFGHFTWCWRGSARRTSFAGLLAGISFKPHCLQTC